MWALRVFAGCFLWIPDDGGPTDAPTPTDADVVRDTSAPTFDPWSDVALPEGATRDGIDHTVWGLFQYAWWGPFSFVGAQPGADWRYEDDFGGVLDACTVVWPAESAAIAPGEGATATIVGADGQRFLMARQDGATRFQSDASNLERLPHRGTLGLEISGWGRVPDAVIPDFTEVPPSNWLQVLEPDLVEVEDGPLPPFEAPFRISWETYDAPADAVWIYVAGLFGAASAMPAVRCLAQDDGVFWIPRDIAPSWPDGSVLDLRVGRLRRTERVVRLDDGTIQRRLAYVEAFAQGGLCVGTCAAGGE